jgi:hypothetical protein
VIDLLVAIKANLIVFVHDPYLLSAGLPVKGSLVRNLLFGVRGVGDFNTDLRS